MQDRDSHAKPIEELVSGLQTHLDEGLTRQEAQDRLQKFGANDVGAFTNDTTVDENLNQTDDWRVNMTNAVSINMSTHLALKVSLQWLYDNAPSLKEVDLFDPGDLTTPIGTVFVEADDIDTLFTTALVVKY